MLLSKGVMPASLTLVVFMPLDGVLDLSTKKNRNRGAVSIRASAPLVKG